MDNREKLLSFLNEIEELAIKNSIVVEKHELKRSGEKWHILIKLVSPKEITLQVQSGKHLGVSSFGK